MDGEFEVANEHALTIQQADRTFKPSVPTVNEFQGSSSVAKQVERLLRNCEANEASAALVPWFCDVLTSPKSRRDYFGDLSRFLSVMRQQGVHAYNVTGDHVRLYKEAMKEQGLKTATIARALSVIRGTYEQFGKKGLVSWQVVGDIQAVKTPRVDKGTTPSLSEKEAVALLHAPDKSTIIGLRDHALLFVYFKTACRFAAIANAKVGDLERTDTDWYLVVREKGSNQRRMPLLESASAILTWLRAAGIDLEDKNHPLFCPLEKDRKTPKRRTLGQQTILAIVKRCARQIDIQVDRLGRRGLCTHSLRKTAINNALEHGATVENVQQWAGHADIRTTQSYIRYRDEGAAEAARRCQIR